MRIAIDMIIEEFRAPFADPRQQRTLTTLSISDERLFYLLIDESKRTFKRGMVVTATVTNVLETKAICRLENGLNATIIKEKILDPDSQEKLRDILDIGYIITGRIDKILTDEGDRKFEVQLNCKKGDLHSHEKYLKDLAESIGIEPRFVREEDKKNLNFTDDQKPKLQGRFTPRRIAHERFKNISSRRALAELENAEVGEFVFRPSTRSEDAITLTWKFWKKHFVHIDI
jgi:transcriptional accessory protein Tex/SPT6